MTKETFCSKPSTKKTDKKHQKRQQRTHSNL